MSANEILQKIPIVVQSPNATKHGGGLGKTRLAVQIASLVAIVLIPILGIFRIDVSAGFVVLGRQIWFSDFYIVFGSWLTLASSLIMFYSTLGTAFCGWVCPQNTLSAWANNLTFKYLGKRAAVNWDADSSAKVANAKNKLSNWLMLGAKLLLVSMAIAIVPMLYFYPPDVVWSFVSFSADERVTKSLYLIFSVFVFIALVNLAVIRYYMCRYMCVYRIWQFLFKSRQTLHVVYDETRADDCLKCNYCETVCPVDINPRNTAVYDSCTNCGECITACSTIHKKHDTSGLLSYKFGERGLVSSSLSSLASRATWALPAFLLGISMFGWGLWNYQAYDVSVYRSEVWQGDHVSDYRISIAHKIYELGQVGIEVEGLPPEAYTLSEDEAHFTTAERKDINLHINKPLSPGLHPFLVRVRSKDGWEDSFTVQHFAEKK